MSFNPRSPLYKLEPKRPSPAPRTKPESDMAPMPFGAPAGPSEKSPIEVARDGYQVVPRGGARPAYEAGPRYDPDDPPHFGRFT
jgi:hypothetical protein